MSSVMGGTYPAPGVTLGPAITFGFIAAREATRLIRSTASDECTGLG